MNSGSVGQGGPDLVMPLTPTNIVAGALVAQGSVLAIMYCGAKIIRREASLVRWYKDQPTYSHFAWHILPLALVSVGTLALSDGLSASWIPLLNPLRFAGLSWSSALLCVFLADIFVVTRLVADTGGSIESPFQPLYFLLPTLALFLREPTPRVILYVCAVATSFSWLLFRYRASHVDDRGRSRIAYGVVSLLCLALACFIGLYLRSPG